MAKADKTQKPSDEIRYISTRSNGASEGVDFAEVLLGGLAPDGGLYLPKAWPQIDFESELINSQRYVDVAFAVMWPFVKGSIKKERFKQIIAEVAGEFDHDDVVNMVDLGDNLWMLELFHGPTLAFKDIALQLVGRLFEELLHQKSGRMTIVGATSGDTGSAAIQACRGKKGVDIFILHPHGRVSEVQRRQMTTVEDSNVHNIAIDGTFDDCQDLVKAMFGDEEFRSTVSLGAVNSINWARVMAQIVYYVYAARRLRPDGSAVSFTVPTGNFGNVFAGYCASQMGLNIHKLVVASNENDILTRFFNTRKMTLEAVTPTVAPSMDIQISSNLERLLYLAMNHDGEALATKMAAFRETGEFELDAKAAKKLASMWHAERVEEHGEGQLFDAIERCYQLHGLLIDPHTAIGVAASRRYQQQLGELGINPSETIATEQKESEIPLITLATAHAAKFSDAVKQATGRTPELPARLSELMNSPERLTVLDNDLTQVQGFITENLSL